MSSKMVMRKAIWLQTTTDAWHQSRAIHACLRLLAFAGVLAFLLLDLPAASPATLRLQSAAPEWFEPLIRLKRGARCSEPPPHQGAQQCHSLARVCTPRLALGEAEFPWASSPWLLLLLVAEQLTPPCWLDCLLSPSIYGNNCLITSILLPLHSDPPCGHCVQPVPCSLPTPNWTAEDYTRHRRRPAWR